MTTAVLSALLLTAGALSLAGEALGEPETGPAPRHRVAAEPHPPAVTQVRTTHRAARARPKSPTRAIRPAPAVRTLNVITSVPIAQGQAAVDRCAGPVEVTYPGATPQIVQHDYCGGTWVLGLRRGEAIRFTGASTGTYRVNGSTRVLADGTPVTSVNGLGDLVAQTCIPGTQSIRIVGLTRVGP